MIGGILAAGEGARMQGSGGHVLKPLVEVAGRPLLLRAADTLVGAGVSALHVILNAGGLSARDRLLSESWPVPVEVTILSTPSSLHSLAALAPRFGQEPALVSTVDAILPPGTAAALVASARAHRRSDATLAVTAWVDDETPLSARLRGDRIVELGTRLPRARWATAGLYCFAPAVWPEVGRAADQGVSRLRNFLGRLLADGFRMHALRVAQTIDVDRPRDVELAERCLARWERAS